LATIDATAADGILGQEIGNGSNSCVNGNFENWVPVSLSYATELPANWTVYNFDEFAITKVADPVSGIYAFKVDGGFCSLRQNINVIAGSTYELSFWAKTGNAGGAFPFVFPMTFGATADPSSVYRNVVGYPGGVSIVVGIWTTMTEAYARYSVQFTIPVGITYIDVHLEVNGNSPSYLDMIELTLINQASPFNNLLLNQSTADGIVKSDSTLSGKLLQLVLEEIVKHSDSLYGIFTKFPSITDGVLIKELGSGSNIAQNSGFETWSLPYPAPPDGWEYQAENEHQRVEQSTDCHAGVYAMRIDAATENGVTNIKQLLYVTVGATINIQFYYKYSAAVSSKATFLIYDLTGSSGSLVEVELPNRTTYGQYITAANVPAGCTQVGFYFITNYDADLYIDDFEIFLTNIPYPIVGKLINAAASDGMFSSDFQTSLKLIVESLAEGSEFADLIITVLNLFVTTHDQITLNDSAASIVVKLLAEISSSGIEVSDVVAVLASLKTVITDRARFEDLAQAVTDLGTMAQNGIMLGDMSILNRILKVTRADGVKLTETVIALISNATSEEFYEGLVFVDEVLALLFTIGPVIPIPNTRILSEVIMDEKYKGAIGLRKKLYIEDFNGKWVDFTNWLIGFPFVTYAMENIFGNFYASANNCIVKNSDGFWNKPFPDDMVTLDNQTAVWSEDSYFSIINLLRRERPSKVQFVIEKTYPDGTRLDEVLGTFFVKNLEVDLGHTANLVLTTAQQLLMNAKAEDVKNGNFWYQYAPVWFLIREVLKKAFGSVGNSGSIELPASFVIPSNAYANVEFEKSVYSLLGRQPNLMDSDNNGVFDNFYKAKGICRAVKWDSVNEFLYLGIDDKLWKMNVDTSICDIVYDFNLNTAEYEWNIVRIDKFGRKLYITLREYINNDEYNIDKRVGDYWSASNENSDTQYFKGSFRKCKVKYAIHDLDRNTTYLASTQEEYDTLFIHRHFIHHLGNINDSDDKFTIYLNEPVFLPFSQRIIFYSDQLPSTKLDEIIIKTLKGFSNQFQPDERHTLSVLYVYKHINSVGDGNQDSYKEYTPLLDPYIARSINLDLNEGIFSFRFFGGINYDYYPAVSEAGFHRDNFFYIPTLKYALGNSGLHKILKSGSNLYKIYFKPSVKLYNTFYYRLNGNFLHINQPNALIENAVDSIYTEKPQIKYPTLNLVIENIDGYSDETLSLYTFENFRGFFDLHPLAICQVKDADYFYLVCRQTADFNQIYPTEILNSLFGHNHCMILKVFYDPYSNNEYVLGSDSENNKNSTYWKDKYSAVYPGVTGTVRFMLDTGETTGGTNKLSWFIPVATSTLLTVKGTLFKAYDTAGESYIEMILDGSLHNATTIDEISTQELNPFPIGDFRKDTGVVSKLHKVAEQMFRSYNFDILDMVQIKDDIFALSFFNKRALNALKAKFGVLIFDMSKLNGFDNDVDTLLSETSPAYIACKLVNSLPKNLTSLLSDQEDDSVEVLYFTLEGDGLTYSWKADEGFKAQAYNLPFDFSDLHTSANLTILDTSNTDTPRIFGSTAPNVDKLYLSSEKNGKYSLWALYNKVYAIVELADFSGMSCMDAIIKLTDALFVTFGIDKFGNVKIISRTESTTVTKSITESDKIYKNIKPNSGLDEIYNKISVIPYESKLQLPSYEITTLIRDTDTELKLSLDIFQSDPKNKTVRLICEKSGYIGEDSSDSTLRWDFLVKSNTDNSVVLNYTQDQDASFTIPSAGELAYSYVRTSNLSNQSAIVRAMDYANPKLGVFKYDSKEYSLESDGVYYVKLTSSINKFQGTGIVNNEVTLTGDTDAPIFKLYISEDPIETKNIQEIGVSDVLIYLGSVFGGTQSENGVKPGYYLAVTDENSSHTIYRKITDVDVTNNTVTLESALGLVIPIKTSINILPHLASSDDEGIEISAINTNEITLVGARDLVCPGMVIKFYDLDTDTFIDKFYRIITCDKDTDGNVLSIKVHSTISLTKDYSHYEIKYYIAPQTLNTYYKLSNTNIQIKINAEFPSYPEQRSFQKGETITITCEGLKLEQANGMTQTVQNLRSIAKFGEKEYPVISDNQFLNIYLAKAKALAMLSLFAYPRLRAVIEQLTVSDIDFFDGDDLYLLQVQNSKIFNSFPEYKETFYLTKITKKGRFVDVEGRAINGYE